MKSIAKLKKYELKNLESISGGQDGDTVAGVKYHGQWKYSWTSDCMDEDGMHYTNLEWCESTAEN